MSNLQGRPIFFSFLSNVSFRIFLRVLTRHGMWLSCGVIIMSNLQGRPIFLLF